MWNWGRWIGRRSTIEKPVRSPDIMLPDFSRGGGATKDMVYSEKPRTLQDFRGTIEEKFPKIDAEFRLSQHAYVKKTFSN